MVLKCNEALIALFVFCPGDVELDRRDLVGFCSRYFDRSANTLNRFRFFHIDLCREDSGGAEIVFHCQGDGAGGRTLLIGMGSVGSRVGFLGTAITPIPHVRDDVAVRVEGG